MANDPLIKIAKAAGAALPVDRADQTLTDGSPVTPDHRELKENGQQKGYVVLSEAERARGFVRPVRTKYVHLKCGAVTSMGLALAETYARDPSFYSGTFCVACGAHFPVGEDGEFVWDGTDEKVGHMIPMKSVKPSARHLKIRDELIASMRKHMGDMPAEEILAIVSYTVGQLLAFQDQRKITPDMAMQIVSSNIEAGNRDAIEQIFKGARDAS